MKPALLEKMAMNTAWLRSSPFLYGVFVHRFGEQGGGEVLC